MNRILFIGLQIKPSNLFRVVYVFSFLNLDNFVSSIIDPPEKETTLVVWLQFNIRTICDLIWISGDEYTQSEFDITDTEDDFKFEVFLNGDLKDLVKKTVEPIMDKIIERKPQVNNITDIFLHLAWLTKDDNLNCQTCWRESSKALL